MGSSCRTHEQHLDIKCSILGKTPQKNHSQDLLPPREGVWAAISWRCRLVLIRLGRDPSGVYGARSPR